MLQQWFSTFTNHSNLPWQRSCFASTNFFENDNWTNTTNHILGFVQYCVLLELSPLKGGFKFVKDNSQKRCHPGLGWCFFLSFNLMKKAFIWAVWFIKLVYDVFKSKTRNTNLIKTRNGKKKITKKKIDKQQKIRKATEKNPACKRFRNLSYNIFFCNYLSYDIEKGNKLFVWKKNRNIISV